MNTNKRKEKEPYTASWMPLPRSPLLWTGHLLSEMKGPGKKLGKAAGIAAATAAVAIGGANLGTYFDQAYHNHPYGSMRNKTAMVLEGDRKPSDPLEEKALSTATLKVVGNKAPEEATVKLRLYAQDGSTRLTAHYTMVWDTNRGLAKRDVEDITINWELRGDHFRPTDAQTRFHYKAVGFSLSQDSEPVIVITNPAHTPAIPGSVPKYLDGKPGLVDIFTVFSAEKWAGSCLSFGYPQGFDSMDVRFNAEISRE